MHSTDKLASARLMAVKKLPYFRAAIYSLVPVQAPGCGTFGVSRTGILLWDPACCGCWSVTELAGVLVHESQHLLREHAARRERAYAEPGLWNVAADISINPDITASGLALPGEGCWPKTFGLADGLAAEEYYRLLERQGREQVKQALGEPSVGHGQCGGCAGNPIEGEDKGEAQAKREGGVGRSEADLARIRRTVAEAIRGATGKQAGSIPGGWARWADEQLQPPKIPWQQKLARAVRGAVAYRPGAVDYCYTHPSRRQAGLGFGAGRPVLPALRAPVPRVAVAIDTSGSMGSPRLVEAVAETRGVLAACGAAVTFIACDASVHAAREVSTWREVARLLLGGGGTNFTPIFQAVTRMRRQPDVLVVVTDGEGPAPAEPPPYRVIWALVSGGRRPVGWGEVVEISKEDHLRERQLAARLSENR